MAKPCYAMKGIGKSFVLSKCKIVCMKFVTLMVTALVLSLSTAAQNTPEASPRKTVTQKQQKKKSPQAKSSRAKAPSAKNTAVTVLVDEKSHNAKWSFEQMLARRMEIDAEDGAKTRGQRKE